MIKSSFEYAVSLMTSVIAQFKSLTVNRCAIKISLNMRNDVMMSPATLMTSTKMIYSQLSESAMRDEDCFVVNVITKRLLPHSIRKPVSFIFHVFDNWMPYSSMKLFNWLKYCFNVGIQSASFLCTTIERCRRLLRSELRSRYLLTQWVPTKAAFESASRSTKLAASSISLSVSDMFFASMRMM